ncbi:MAG: ABC transporter permease [Corynebacterium casei]|uniref:Transport permease protein n=3 Tax=Corynebacterium casei TaxID=160386 RepID=G7HUS7_9CORY|nr:ABC transporter permease [Corynebacterium casei]AHI19294.1 putative integral membrane protein [Corynebacterium casei LMG S-19264]MDN5707250.1 ABC transporter permease [Corynebacterium casei]MDN5728333.1 ABC transporter permease [Corynebacterium casei]MDN5740382.1 ABC transporter permease [Corynebacterium casei]MDN5799585.1 ABC transporter permease [Corynebacterium casei]
MTTYRALVTALWRSQRRDPVGLFFSFAFAPVLVIILGAIFGNDARAEFGGMGFLDATLPAFASLVLAMIGVLQVPVAMLTLRESGALRRLSLTPLRRGTFVAAALTVHFAVGILGMLTALTLGVLAFGVSLPSNIVGVLAVCVVGLCAFLALGCALSTIYPSTAAATGLGNILMILLMLTSGAFSPLSAMPEGIQNIIKYSPVRWFVDAAQLSWAGDPLRDMVAPVILLLIVLVVAGIIGITRFRWDVAH